MNQEPESTTASSAMSRREALKRAAALMGGVLSAPTVAGVLAGCGHSESSTWTPRTLTEEQSKRVAAVAECILPETDTPGAREAHVHRFIDVMLSDYYPPRERKRFLEGLARLGKRTQRAFGKPFLELDSDQQLQVVEALNSAAFRRQEPQRDANAAVQDSAKQSSAGARSRSSATEPEVASGVETLDKDWSPADVGGGSFFRMLKELTVVGYYTSEAGATQELAVNPMGGWEADIPYAEVGHGWA